MVELEGGGRLVITGEQRDGRFTRLCLLLNAAKLGVIIAHPFIT